MQGNAQREQVKRGGRNVDNEEMNKKEEWKRRGTGEMTCGEIQKEGRKEGRKKTHGGPRNPKEKDEGNGNCSIGKKRAAKKTRGTIMLNKKAYTKTQKGKLKKKNEKRKKI